MWNCRRRWPRCSTRPTAFRENVHLDPGLPMDQLWPGFLRLLNYLEPTDRCGPQKVVDACLGKNDINVLRYSPYVTMPSNGPTATHHAFTTASREHLV